MRIHRCSSPLCLQFAEYRGKCREHAQENNVASHDPQRRALYTGGAWRGYRLRRLALNPICEWPGCDQSANEVDHIVPIAQGGEVFSIANTQCLCKRHHAAKTRQESLGRGAYTLEARG